MNPQLKKRLFKMAFKTISGKQAQGYFLPYRYADQVPQPGKIEAYTHLENLFEGTKATFKDILGVMNQYQDRLASFNETEPPTPRWQQTWFPRLDGATAYSMVRNFKPTRIIEVGSGHSTRFLYQAIEDEGLNCDFQAIDPQPRADITKLDISITNSPVQDVDPTFFDGLEKNDILFIDSSHLLVPGSDVDYLFNRILPKLPKGVLVHIHDITLPYDYPDEWTWRGYNEQQGVVPLMSFGAFDLLWSSTYVSKNVLGEMPDHFAHTLFLDPEAFETSLWLRKS